MGRYPQRPSLEEVLELALEYGRRHAGCKMQPVEPLLAALEAWLFGDNGVWLCVDAGLITEQEARYLLMGKIHRFYEHVLGLGGMELAYEEDEQENLRFDMVLFGR